MFSRKPSPTLVTVLVAAFVFSGCATNWSEPEKARLAHVAVAPVTVGKAAYKKPDATISPGMANSLPIATGGGLIPSLIGSAIDAAVTSKQQKKFEAGNAQYFDGLAKKMESPPNVELQAALKETLGTHDFFGSRLAEQAPATFNAEIVSYGLEKSPLSKKDDVLLRMRIIARLSLITPDGKTFWIAQIAGVAETAETAAHASEILADPTFIAKSIHAAARSFAEQAAYQLDQKLKTKP